MATMGPEYRVGSGTGGTATYPSGLQAHSSTTMNNSNRPDVRQTLVCTQSYVQTENAFIERHHKNKTSFHQQREAERGWNNLATPLHTVGPTMHLINASTTAGAPYSPESVEMDEIMAAMVLTSLSCSPVVQSPSQTDCGPAGSSSADMECGGGELFDSGSSGYFSWDHGNMSPTPLPSVTDMDSSLDEGLHMELEQGEELNAKKLKSSSRAVYKCLWPSCGKVLTSSVGIKRHIQVLHLGSGSDHSQREEDFYYTKISCETVDASSNPAPLPQDPGQASSPLLIWASCGSPPGSGLQTPPAHRPRSNSASGPGQDKTSPLSQSAPSSFWQIHSEHLYQACSPTQISVAPRSPGCQHWTPPASVSGHSNTSMVKPRCRSVSVGEQWLQQNRLQPLSTSPSGTHCSFRKGRGEAKKCRKVYGVEQRNQWCTACRWKKACQRFPV